MGQLAWHACAAVNSKETLPQTEWKTHTPGCPLTSTSVHGKERERERDKSVDFIIFYSSIFAGLSLILITSMQILWGVLHRQSHHNNNGSFILCHYTGKQLQRELSRSNENAPSHHVSGHKRENLLIFPCKEGYLLWANVSVLYRVKWIPFSQFSVLLLSMNR